MSKFAIIQIRGTIGVPFTIKDTLEKLKLKKKHNCRIIEDSPSIRGMFEKIRHLVTWGSIDDETLTLLKAKGEGPVFALHPPRKGFGRKGVKMPFSKGGTYGDRKEKINELIKRML